MINEDQNFQIFTEFNKDIELIKSCDNRLMPFKPVTFVLFDFLFSSAREAMASHLNSISPTTEKQNREKMTYR